jgi:hypothetical protein
MYWMVQIFGLILPILVMLPRQGRKPFPMLIVSFFVILDAWFKGFLIVIPSLQHPYLLIQDVDESYRHYFPTWEERDEEGTYSIKIGMKMNWLKNYWDGSSIKIAIGMILLFILANFELQATAFKQDGERITPVIQLGFSEEDSIKYITENWIFIYMSREPSASCPLEIILTLPMKTVK